MRVVEQTRKSAMPVRSFEGKSGFAHRKAMLLAKVEEISHHMLDRDSLTVERAPDLLDYLQAMSDRVIVADAMSRDFSILRDVQDALKAIETGEYGECQTCGNVIPPKRLDALPWARHCVPCQEAEERRRHGQDVLEDAA